MQQNALGNFILLSTLQYLNKHQLCWCSKSSLDGVWMFSVSLFILFQLQLEQWKAVTLIHLFPLATPLKDSTL